MNQYHMTAPGDGVIVGLSGGADSVCLLYLLWCLKDELGISLRAVHVHHGIRGEEAERDAQFSLEFCRNHEILCRLVRIEAEREAREQGISVEEAGRLARYRIFEEEAAGWETEGLRVRIATAHHADDNAETILHNLLRGSGLKGLGGIAPVRERIIRPLLWVGRSDIRTFLTEEGISWVEDSSNGENDYTRNRIRNEILPMLKTQINTRAAEHILQAGGQIRRADHYFEKKAGEWLECHRRADALPLSKLRECEEIEQGYIIRRMLSECGCPLKDITARHIEELLALADKGTGKTVMLPHDFLAVTEYGLLRFLNQGKKQDSNGKAISGSSLKMQVFPCKNAAEFPKNQYTKWFDYDKIKDTLSVRYRRPGDYITLASGGRKTVKAFMIDEKIPRTKRDRILLLADGNHILWIVGYRMSEFYKITQETKTILQVQLVDGGKNGG